MASNLILLCVFLWAFSCMINGQLNECKDHKEQSPININTEEAQEEDLCVIPFNWNVDYNHEGFRVENNGHTVEVSPVAGESKEKIEESVVIATFNNIFKEEDHHKEYHLAQYHFHWGSKSDWGSEHTIDKKHFPLEVHFVHFASDSKSVKEALSNHVLCVEGHEHCDTDDHSLGVISILFDIKDEDNPAFDAILSESIVEEIKDYTKPEPHAYVKDAKLQDLINNVHQGGYYSYEGSLTTPPCFEIVRWFVMKKRSYISGKQMERFREIQRDPKFFAGSGHTTDGNFRQIQKYLDYKVINCAEHGDGSKKKNSEDGGNGSDSGDSKNSDNDSSDETAAALFNENKQLKHGENNTTIVSLHFSKETLMNIWILFGLLTVTNIIFCFVQKEIKVLQE